MSGGNTSYFVLTGELNSMLSIIWLFLFFLGVALVVFTVMVIGGVLVALVSLTGLFVFPTVRQQTMTFIGEIFGREFDSIRDWRFVALYVVCVDSLGVVLIPSTAAFMELSSRSHLTGQTVWVLVGGVIVAIGSVLIAINYRTETQVRLRTVGEWSAFLCFSLVLTVVAIFFVPMLFIMLLGLFI